MAFPAMPMILWGPGLENVLRFSIADMRAPGRLSRAGSRSDYTGAGRVDAWTTGFDYTLEFDARWVPEGDSTFPSPASGMSSQGGVQDFLEWARDKNTFRYCPNSDWPDFWVDGCYLSNTDVEEALESANETGTVHLVLRNPTYDFSLAERGLFMEYAPAATELPPVFSLGGGAGIRTFTDKDGVLRYAASGKLRDRDYLYGTRVAMFEEGGANQSTQPETLDNAAWTKTLVTITANSATVGAPDQSLTVDKLVENNDASPQIHTCHFTFTITAGDRMSCTIHLKAAERTRCIVYFSDSEAGADKLGANVTMTGAGTATALVAGAAVMTAGPKIRALTNGWYELRFSGTLNAGTTNCFFVIRMADDAGTGTYDGDGTSGFYAWGAMVTQDSPEPGSYFNGTRVLDKLTGTWPWKPQPMWVYLKFIELGYAAVSGAAGPFLLGTAAAVAGLNILRYDRFGPPYRFSHQDGFTGVGVTPSGTPALGDTVECMGLLFADGSISARQSINGAADTTAGPSAAFALTETWLNQLIDIPGNGASLGLIQAKFGRDISAVTTIALARAA